VDLFGFEAGDRKHVEEALRHVAAQLFQQWVRTAPVQPGDDVGDRRADARYIAQSVMTDDAVERLGQRGEAVRRAEIGFRAEIIVACERRAPAELDQQNRYRRGVERWHLGVASPTSSMTIRRRHAHSLTWSPPSTCLPV